MSQNTCIIRLLHSIFSSASGWFFSFFFLCLFFPAACSFPLYEDSAESPDHASLICLPAAITHANQLTTDTVFRGPAPNPRVSHRSSGNSSPLNLKTSHCTATAGAYEQTEVPQSPRLHGIIQWRTVFFFFFWLLHSSLRHLQGSMKNNWIIPAAPRAPSTLFLLNIWQKSLEAQLYVGTPHGSRIIWDIWDTDN